MYPPLPPVTHDNDFNGQYGKAYLLPSSSISNNHGSHNTHGHNPVLVWLPEAYQPHICSEPFMYYLPLHARTLQPLADHWSSLPSPYRKDIYHSNGWNGVVG
jgi:hypothetical protein